MRFENVLEFEIEFEFTTVPKNCEVKYPKTF